VDHEIRVSDDGTYVILRVIGPTGRHRMAQVVAAHAFGAERGIHHYLVDLTEAFNVESAIDDYEMANKDFPAAPLVNRFARVAGLTKPGDRSHDFLAMVLRNSGNLIEMFDDLASAEAYIRG
jgi:hypothetical protein